MSVGRKPLLTAEQAAEIRARYELWRKNRPAVLAREYGLSIHTLRDYARGAQKGLNRGG